MNSKSLTRQQQGLAPGQVGSQHTFSKHDLTAPGKIAEYEEEWDENLNDYVTKVKVKYVNPKVL